MGIVAQCLISYFNMSNVFMLYFNYIVLPTQRFTYEADMIKSMEISET